MVSSRNSPSEWTIPGGGLEPNEEPGQTAVREAAEEVTYRYRVDILTGYLANSAARSKYYYYKRPLPTIRLALV